MVVQADEVRDAIARDELLFHYQPKVSFLTGRVDGAEALVRWRRDDGSVLRAANFMPEVSQCGLASEITRHMFPRLVRDLGAIRESNPATRVAFNVSAEDLEQAGLVSMVRNAISGDGFDAACLEIEVTEGTAVSADPAVARSLTGLLAAGVQLSMDDYGVGFSSLETLNRLPFSALKMDQGFVLRMLRSPKSATLVRTSIAMAQLLGIRTVVEGIESADVYAALMHYGCDEGQGYWISPPLSLQEYVAFLQSDRRWPCSPVGMLRMAQLTHIWQLKLLVDLIYAFLKQASPPDQVPAALHIGHRECALGHWYYGVGQNLGGDPDFDGLEAPHRALHELCGQVLQEVRTGTESRAPIRSLMHDLSQRSCQLGSSLQRLETRLLLAELDACAVPE
jgi:EAL domain-containing protein (putative c-di-GMP-specific phosphodiesterase class I)